MIEQSSHVLHLRHPRHIIGEEVHKETQPYLVCMHYALDRLGPEAFRDHGPHLVVLLKPTSLNRVTHPSHLLLRQIAGFLLAVFSL